jgi:hypothetical protein
MRRTTPSLLLVIASGTLVTALFAASSIDATCRCGAGDLELVFVMDATGSMGPVIGTVKAQAARIIEILESQVESLRVGGVAFRTRDDAEMAVPSTRDLTANRAELASWLKTLTAQAGGEEAVDDGLDAAISQMSWTAKARKVVVLIGDEGPTGAAQDRLVALATQAAARGIVVHTITQSDTAWLYHLNWLRNTDPAAAEAVMERYGSLEKLKTTFRLPIFEKVANAGKGRAVGTADTREIVKWLLAFALGYDEDDQDPPEVPAPSTQSIETHRLPEHDGRAHIGWVRYAGEWQTPRSFDGLVRHLGSLVRIDIDEQPVVVRLSDEGLWRYPILYLSGHGPVQLSAEERDGLKRYVASGGLLWADSCCGKPLFDRTLRDELAKAFPGVRLAPLDRGHPLFDIGHAIDSVRYSTAHRKNEYTKQPPIVHGLEIGRGAVLYTPHSLGAGWKTFASGMSCMMHDDDALKLSENILLYAFSR